MFKASAVVIMSVRATFLSVVLLTTRCLVLDEADTLFDDSFLETTLRVLRSCKV
jgi:superfamily II DNA/RNA helicase